MYDIFNRRKSSMTRITIFITKLGCTYAVGDVGHTVKYCV